MITDRKPKSRSPSALWDVGLENKNFSEREKMKLQTKFLLLLMGNR
jgi:hypothetical protein